nr:hypothetical protein GCM10020093_054660 [Planobispora longispora]
MTWNFAEAVDDLTVAMYFTTGKTDPDLVKRFTAAMNESLTYAQGHPEEAREVLKTYTKIAPEVIAEIRLPRWGTEINRDSVQAIADLAQGDGVLKGKVDVAALIP